MFYTGSNLVSAMDNEWISTEAFMVDMSDFNQPVVESFGDKLKNAGTKIIVAFQNFIERVIAWIEKFAATIRALRKLQVPKAIINAWAIVVKKLMDLQKKFKDRMAASEYNENDVDSFKDALTDTQNSREYITLVNGQPSDYKESDFIEIEKGKKDTILNYLKSTRDQLTKVKGILNKINHGIMPNDGPFSYFLQAYQSTLVSTMMVNNKILYFGKATKYDNGSIQLKGGVDVEVDPMGKNKKAEEKKESNKAKFQKSVDNARKAGVPEDKILKDKKDVDNYFAGKEEAEEEFRNRTKNTEKNAKKTGKFGNPVTFKNDKTGKVKTVTNSKGFNKAMGDKNNHLVFGEE